MPTIIMTTAGSKLICATALLEVLAIPLVAAPKPPAKVPQKVTATAKPKKVDVAALNTALFQAIGYKDVVAMKRLLAQGASASARLTSEIDNQLRYKRAISEANSDSATLKGQKPPAVERSQFARTALMAATQMHSADAVRLLIKHGADVNATVDTVLLQDGRWGTGEPVMPRGRVTALDFAVKVGNKPIVQLLLTAGAKLPSEQDMIPGNNARLDPLLVALENNHPEIAKMLLHAGAEVSLRSQDGTFALEHALSNDNLELANLLLARGVNKAACTAAIFPAIQIERFHLLGPLLQGGADPNVKDKYGLTPLHYMAQYDNTELFAFRNLLGVEEISEEQFGQKSSDVKPKTPQKAQAKAFQEKVLKQWTEYREAARLLILAGARVNELSNAGFTPLQQALETYNVPLVEFLLDNGADPNLASQPYPSPLRLLTHFGPPSTALDDPQDVRIARKLIEKGADLKSKDNRSALGAACEYGNLPMVKLLLQSGASTEEPFEPLQPFLWPKSRGATSPEEITEKERDGNVDKPIRISHRGFTPLLISARMGETETLRALLASKANCRVTDLQGNSALHHLVQGGKWNPALSQESEFHPTRQSRLKSTWNLLSPGNLAFLTEPAEHLEKTREASAVNASAAKLLLDSGCDASVKNNQGQTALQICLIAGDIRVAEILQKFAPTSVPSATLYTIIKRGRRTSRIEPVLAEVYSRLWQAEDTARSIQNGKQFTQKILLHGQKSAFAYRHGLLEYCGQQDAKAVQIAVEAGAQVNARDNSGLTPLMSAVRAGHLEAIRQLIHAKSDVNALDQQGESVLMQIVRYGNRNRKTSVFKGHTEPEEKLREATIRQVLGREDAALISLLLKAGAKPNLKNPKGQTALDLAVSLKHPEAIQALRSTVK